MEQQEKDLIYYHYSYLLQKGLVRHLRKKYGIREIDKEAWEEIKRNSKRVIKSIYYCPTD